MPRDDGPCGDRPRGAEPPGDGRRALGDAGERVAAEHLERRGHRILARNVRTRAGEIDLVTADGTTVVFVEVRTRRGRGFGTAIESVDRRKRARLVRLAQAFLTRHGLLDRVARFDVVGVDWSGPAPVIEHLESAFEAGD